MALPREKSMKPAIVTLRLPKRLASGQTRKYADAIGIPPIADTNV